MIYHNLSAKPKCAPNKFWWQAFLHIHDMIVANHVLSCAILYVQIMKHYCNILHKDPCPLNP